MARSTNVVVVNQIGRGAGYICVAIIHTDDDGSGHRFRVPLVVVTRPHYVWHTWRDFASILRLIELPFNVPRRPRAMPARIT